MGKRSPETDNRTAEGRFINRRVELVVTDSNGRLVREGGIAEAITAIDPLADQLAQLKADEADNWAKVQGSPNSWTRRSASRGKPWPP